MVPSDDICCCHFLDTKQSFEQSFLVAEALVGIRQYTGLHVDRYIQVNRQAIKIKSWIIHFLATLAIAANSQSHLDESRWNPRH
jgi:hypothetical protein